ncbi:hypothetical protein ACA106_00360 [Agrobacterium pusense]|uniref:Uncharacterized protein n=1 Tax=Agrobacterium pusense TaxID=648995 RepID=U4QHZ3_9HYPH|nr:hypothetical protein [Agrobacterium pusense]CDI11954.1 protein of unknown function [Agrobacterium pusense]
MSSLISYLTKSLRPVGQSANKSFVITLFNILIVAGRACASHLSAVLVQSLIPDEHAASGPLPVPNAHSKRLLQAFCRDGVKERGRTGIILPDIIQRLLAGLVIPISTALAKRLTIDLLRSLMRCCSALRRIVLTSLASAILAGVKPLAWLARFHALKSSGAITWSPRMLSTPSLE